MTPEQTQLLETYKQAQASALAWKEYEQSLRTQVVASFGDASKHAGTERLVIDTGEELVMGKRLNYKVINDNGQVFYLASVMPKEIFDDIFKITYGISITAYKKLSKAQQQFIDPALQITEGMPTLKIEPTTKVI